MKWFAGTDRHEVSKGSDCVEAPLQSNKISFLFVLGRKQMEDSAGTTVTKGRRVVRVFISSTFRDMHEEREVLVKKTFPELRRKCLERQVDFVGVDLRWGVTDEEKSEGKVLPICLAEIENCRPYFIGILGARYGWVPEEISPGLVEQQPWLQEHFDKSVTELEIVHGVLRKPEMATKAFFHFRDPRYAGTVQAERCSDFASEESAAKSKLENLKDRIRQSGMIVREDYPDPTELADLVLEDLWHTIDEEFPASEIPDPLDKEALEHLNFAESRANVYIAREDDFRRLDNHVNGDGPPLVILGKSGIGKSALVANWALEYGKSSGSHPCILHFVGSSPQSADYISLMSRSMKEIARCCGLEAEIPETADEIRQGFAESLFNVPADKRLILVFDGLDRLEDKDN